MASCEVAKSHDYDHQEGLTSSTCCSRMTGKMNIKASADPTKTSPVMKQEGAKQPKQHVHLLQPITIN